MIFIIHFELIKDFYESLRKNSNDKNARKKLIDINNILNQINEQNNNFGTWIINNLFKIINVVDEAPTKSDVKIKVNICILNESNDLTSLEMVVIVKKAEYNLRVIVNRETSKNFFFKIYLGADFDKKIVKKWLKFEGSIKHLSTNTKIKHITIYEHVKIWSGHKASQFYMIKIENDDFIVNKSTFFKIKGFSFNKLKRIDKLLNEQNAQLRYELDLCQKKNEYSNTKK